MRRRIVRTIVAVTALAVLTLAVPLGIAIAAVYRGETVQRLVDDASRTAATVPGPPLTPADPAELPVTEDGAVIGIYAPDGSRMTGSGPSKADAVTRQALSGHVNSASGGAEVVVAVPVGAQEQIVAAVRAAVPQTAVDDRIHGAWLLLAGLGVLAITAAAAVAAWQARRLGRPVEALAVVAERIGQGDFTARARPSQVAEVDTVGRAMNATAERLGVVLERERAFSADASHQLRTPLTALRLQLESAVMREGTDHRHAIEAALEQIDRLEQTVESLLLLARDIPGDRQPLDIARLLESSEAEWRARFAASGRPFELAVPTAAATVAVSAAAVQQILDVLVDNALIHGRGGVRVEVRQLAGGVAIDVSDEGPEISGGSERLFTRRHAAAAGRGIGLALARSLAEAERGRLILAAAAPHPVFRLVLPEPAEP